MIKSFADWVVYSVFKLSPDIHLAEAVNFFIYDTIKILLLLAVIIFIVSVIRSFFPPERTRSILSHEKKYIGNVVAAFMGIVTPFCTCSAIPLFLGFLEAGVPLGVTFSFLVSSPMVNEVALVMLWGLFGWKIALIYITSGVLIAIFSGIFIGALKVEGLIEHSRINNKASFPLEFFKIGFRDRLKIAGSNTIFIIKGIWLFVVIGIGVGAWIHGYVPQDFLARYAGRDNLFSVPLATLIGIPLYSNASGVIPMVRALVEKGVGMGTALAFMMAVTALSLPEAVIFEAVMLRHICHNCRARMIPYNRSQ
jgi:uncharacterized membrane protein YraQ (UPF0718 family)